MSESSVWIVTVPDTRDACHDLAEAIRTVVSRHGHVHLHYCEDDGRRGIILLDARFVDWIEDECRRLGRPIAVRRASASDFMSLEVTIELDLAALSRRLTAPYN